MIQRTAPTIPAAPTAEDLIAFFDLRTRLEDYFERAGEAWLHARMEEKAPGFEYVTNWNVFLSEIAPEGPVFTRFGQEAPSFRVVTALKTLDTKYA